MVVAVPHDRPVQSCSLFVTGLSSKSFLQKYRFLKFRKVIMSLNDTRPIGFCGRSLDGAGNEISLRDYQRALQDGASWPEVQSHLAAWAVSGVFAFAAIILSFILIRQHLQFYYKPIYQRHIVRILLMVPVYSFTAWMTFRYFHLVVYFDFIRGVYESFVIYEFFTLLLRYVGETDEEISRVLAAKQPRKLPFPLFCFSFSPASPHFLMDARIGAMQYVLLRPINTTLAVIMELSGVYCAESMSPSHGRFWVVLINFFSTSIAMYTLVTFYLTIRMDIVEHKPITKFLSVKFVIFFCFWQSLVIAFLSNVGVIHSTHYWTIQNAASGLQSFLICIEMFIAALWHMRDKCFGYADFKPSTLGGAVAKKTNKWESFQDAFGPSLWLADAKNTLNHMGLRLTGKAKVQPTSERLLTDEESGK